MKDSQQQIDSLIEMAVTQKAELKQILEFFPILRDHLSGEIERSLEEIEPAIRSELEIFISARATDAQAKISSDLSAKIDAITRNLESTTAARYSVLMAEREQNAVLLTQAEARIAEVASALPAAVKGIVTDELSRFPRAGEIDQLRKEFAEPRGLNPRGRWTPNETYQRLDLVTFNGDSFVSNINGNRERPGRNAADWTLSAARGNSGGGGGITSLTDILPIPSSGQILGSNNTSYVPKNLVAGANITITETTSQITITGNEGEIELSDGTEAAPSLSFTSDANTGIYRPTADTVGIVGGGNDVVRLTGVASATDYLEVKNGIGVATPLHILAEGASTNIGVHLQPKGSGLFTISDGTDFNKGIRFRSSSSAASAVTLIDAVSTSGRVITLPDATDTLVGRATTDALSNKTITASSFSGTTVSATGAGDFGTTATSGRLTLGQVTSAVVDDLVILRTGSTKTAWAIGAQSNVDNGFEITPSTAVGGTTFTTPAFRVTSSGVLASGNILSSSATGGIGYTTGAGGTQTQGTSRTTAVTRNSVTGSITLFTAAGSATATSFTVNNTSVAINDTISLSVRSATNKYLVFVTAVAANSFEITFYTTGGTASDAPVINFNVIKGATS